MGARPMISSFVERRLRDYDFSILLTSLETQGPAQVTLEEVVCPEFEASTFASNAGVDAQVVLLYATLENALLGDNRPEKVMTAPLGLEVRLQHGASSGQWFRQYDGDSFSLHLNTLLDRLVRGQFVSNYSFINAKRVHPEVSTRKIIKPNLFRGDNGTSKSSSFYRSDDLVQQHLRYIVGKKEDGLSGPEEVYTIAKNWFVTNHMDPGLSVRVKESMERVQEKHRVLDHWKYAKTPSDIEQNPAAYTAADFIQSYVLANQEAPFVGFRIVEEKSLADIRSFGGKIQCYAFKLQAGDGRKSQPIYIIGSHESYKDEIFHLSGKPITTKVRFTDKSKSSICEMRDVLARRLTDWCTAIAKRYSPKGTVKFRGENLVHTDIPEFSVTSGPNGFRTSYRAGQRIITDDPLIWYLQKNRAKLRSDRGNIDVTNDRMLYEVVRFAPSTDTIE